MSRPYDLILLGATGFTGRFVAQYLLKTYGWGGDLKWAIAGRNLGKLHRLRDELGQSDLPYFVADSLDPTSLDQMTAQAKVLCSTVGPFAKYGSEVVASCVRQGTHYCDITGEIQWIKRMIDAHHQEAEAKKLRIVHCCGFDSIPSDLGVFWLQKQAKERTGQYCRHIKTGLKAAKGGFSGGTITSLTSVVEEAYQDKSLFGLLNDPYGLNPDGQKEGPDRRDLREVVYDEDFKSWICPFVMAPINTKVVRRGHALRDYPYGRDFRYEEVSLTGDGLGGKIKGYAIGTVLGLFYKAKPGSFSKWMLDKITPDPGQGPSPKSLENGFWVYDQVGILPDGEILRSRISTDYDPGYGSTSRMLGESAVCLAQDELPENYGMQTPASAMGDKLLTRLQEKAEVKFRMK